MEVEATHLDVFSPQMNTNRGFIYSGRGNLLGYNSGAQMGSAAATPVPLMNAMTENLLPRHQSLFCDNSLQPKTSMNTESGLTYNVPVQRKRPRDSFEQLIINSPNTNFGAPMKNAAAGEIPYFSSFLGDQILPQIQQYQIDIDSIISQHTKKIRLEVEERQKQHSRSLVAAIGEGLMKKLKDKDEHIQRMGKLNLALQERVKSLYFENQFWKDLAQTNEATANSLRINLEQALAHVSDDRLSTGAAAVAAVVEDDAESCCGSNDYGRADDDGRESEERRISAEEAQVGRACRIAEEAQDNRMCKLCGEKESCVLLLPCRHLCLCTNCGSVLLQTCPVCNHSMNGTVHVNMSC